MLFDSLSSPLILTLRLAPNTIILMMRLSVSTPFLIRIHTPILTLFLFFFSYPLHTYIFPYSHAYPHLILTLILFLLSHPHSRPYLLSQITSLSSFSFHILILGVPSHSYPHSLFTLLTPFSLHILILILSSHPYLLSPFTPLFSVSLHTLILTLILYLPSRPYSLKRAQQHRSFHA